MIKKIRWVMGLIGDGSFRISYNPSYNPSCVGNLEHSGSRSGFHADVAVGLS